MRPRRGKVRQWAAKDGHIRASRHHAVNALLDVAGVAAAIAFQEKKKGIGGERQGTQW